VQDADEMQRALAQPVGEPLDEDELEQELAALELEEQALQDTGPPSYAAVFRSAPNTELRPPGVATTKAAAAPRVAVAVSTKSSKEDEDFSQLAASMI
jgi:hypothetical protein